MKKFKLKELGVQELDVKEMINVNGGAIPDLNIIGPIVNVLDTILLRVGSILNSVLKLLQGL
jgi:hypothetical protein